MNDKKIALYLRLSMADGDLDDTDKTESNSIENQRELLLSYISSNGELHGDVCEYVDDGYTGTNFNRPGFKNLMRDVCRGNIGTILVKDLSRLGRDYIGVGDYVEQVFPMMGIRFIAVGNSFDSDAYIGKTMGLDMAMGNLVNSLYSKDVSKKIRSSLEIKWKQGIATSSLVPYGYVWDAKSKKRWKIDPVASLYVREVFDYALTGLSIRNIVDKLNQEGVLPPIEYARKTGKNVYHTDVPPEEERKWRNLSVYYILRNYAYTGALVMRKKTAVSVVRSIYEDQPLGKTVVVEGAHEAIVSHEDFEKTQRMLRKINVNTNRKKHEYALRGIVRCGNCRRLLVRQGRHSERMMFFCAYKRETGSHSGCYGGLYKESDINEKVERAITEVAALTGVLSDILERRQKKDAKALGKPDVDSLRREIAKIKAENIRMYEDYTDGKLRRAEYISRKNVQSERLRQLEEEIKKAESRMREREETLSVLNQLTEEGTMLDKGISSLEDVISDFVETVYLYDADNMKIVFKCEDVIQSALEQCGADADEALSWCSNNNAGDWLSALQEF